MKGFFFQNVHFKVSFNFKMKSYNSVKIATRSASKTLRGFLFIRTFFAHCNTVCLNSKVEIQLSMVDAILKTFAEKIKHQFFMMVNFCCDH